jgi:oxygen-independent coproporphyrinogen-3 oxidase
MPAPGRGAPGIYVHVPFCSKICPYCDFAVTTPGGGRRQSYLPALLGEIEIAGRDPWRGAAAPAPADTIYFGGGTPSLLEPDELSEILAALATRLDMVAEPWLGLEANPEDVTAHRLAAWRQLGVRFLSLGVQSFDDDGLAFLGRRHTAAEARTAVATAVAAGIETVSIDLICCLPGQSPGHDHGYQPYEVCSFAAAAEHRSRHNPKYWRHAPYLGLGPSAHSFDGRRRWWNCRQLGQWAAAVAQACRPIQDEELLAPEQLALEELMLALRTVEGIGLTAFQERHGVNLVEANRDVLPALRSDGLVVLEHGRLRATPSGLAVADGLARSFELVPASAS